MSGFTIHFTVTRQAASARQAVNEVEAALARVEDMVWREAGLIFSTEGVTDSDGEWVNLEETADA